MQYRRLIRNVYEQMYHDYLQQSAVANYPIKAEVCGPLFTAASSNNDSLKG